MVQVPKKSGVSGHLYFTQVLRWIPISGIEVVLFSREWRIGGTEVSDSTSPETMHEPRPEILNIAGTRPKLPRNLLVGTNPAKIVAAARDTLAGKGKAGRIPHLWDGHTAKRIVDILLKEVPRGQAS